MIEDLGKVETSAEGDRKFLLVGMLDSPFVRRVAIALLHYDYVFENLSVATMAQEAEFARFSPLKRAPTLVLPGGEALFDSHLILQHLDDFAPIERALLPTAMAARLSCRQVMGIAAGLADKAVSATYEKVFHQPEAQSQRLLRRIRGQLLDALLWLEEVAPSSDFLFGAELSHADIIVGTGLCFAREQHPDLLPLEQAPKVAAWCARLDALPSFQQTYLAVVPPSG